ncbi:Abi-alpha family protein [Limosilactobacillus antri]|uniref:Abi-alpha family protein n=1 Tax=Limosilactobacillus antri TaxID=227943 RepID=UPI001F55D580|nr:Abi-alpha family protein [Limosilactobacillus antri]
MDPNQIEAVANWLPTSSKELLLNPSFKAIGLGISGIFYKVFGKAIKYGIIKSNEVDDLINRTSQKVSQIPIDKQTLAKRGLIMKSIEDSQYSLDSEYLREMFAQLISRSANTDYAGGIYPIFPTILSNMASHDAYFLQKLKYEGKISDFVPLEDFIAYGKDKSSGAELSYTYENHLTIIRHGNTTFIDRPEQTINLLESFGIMKIEEKDIVLFKKDYEELEKKHLKSPEQLSQKDFICERSAPKRQVLGITDLGKLFLESIL